eukprot:TRINITY_DN495_c0_g1_i3.p1 TRINITY_DN495_c0_g1~~TRINITY_DN495_c0_g1_i3.p1  ORF type:complete len:469 (+),score=122.58 TRINITY_DN495_c0_g1_i3:84-1409(+)
MSGKVRKERKAKALRHDPLEKQILDSNEKGVLRLPKKKKTPKNDEDFDEAEVEEFVSNKISSKILKEAHKQQEDLAREYDEFDEKEVKSNEKFSSLRAAADNDSDEDDLGEIPDSEDLDQGENEINPEDEKTLEMFLPRSAPATRTLADIIFEKIREREQAANLTTPEAKQAAIQQRLDPKVVQVYTKVGQVLSRFSSGKVPKAFKIIPSLKNWEEIVFLTCPEKWSPNAMFVATKLFVSNMTPKLVQKFLSMVLLPQVREDIAKHKCLNFHLYMSLKKAVYKPVAFFKGVILPMAEEGATPREATILSSVLSKVSIPVGHVGVALLKLSSMPYTGTSSLFIKTLLNKKYSLPLKVIAALVDHFCSFEEDERKLPLLWYQTLLVFAQRYKTSLTDEQKERLKSLLRRHVHHLLTAEIRRELFGVQHGDQMMNDNEIEMKLA